MGHTKGNGDAVYIDDLIERMGSKTLTSIDFAVDHSAVWGEHPGVLLLEHNVHLNYEL